MRKTIAFCTLALLLLSFAVIETRELAMKEQLDLFAEFYALVDKNYVDSLNLPGLMTKTMDKTLSELDPYSHYYDIEETKKHDEGWKGVLYAGMGSSVKQADSGVTIVDPYEGLPAMRVGLRTGDVIYEINGQNVRRLALDSVIKLLKGKAGDSVQLKLKRPYVGYVMKKFAREPVTNPAVPLYFIQKDSTGYIAFSHFMGGSGDAMKKAFSELKAKGAKKLVLDLRGNYGGLVDECVAALGAFFPDHKLICSLRMKDSTGNYSYYTNTPPIDTGMPIIVLTDRRTISAGEIFAGCLKDHKRATLIGDRTYGKGFVQGTRYMKQRQSVYLTVARYYLPAGDFIGAKGVDPDFVFTKADSLPPDLQAIINSGVIIDYSVKIRNTKGDTLNFKDLSYTDFIAFYQTRLSSIELPEEKALKQLENYNSAKTMKAEIRARKQQLAMLYKKEIEIELKKELLRRYYRFSESGAISFQQSVMAGYLVEKGYMKKD